MNNASALSMLKIIAMIPLIKNGDIDHQNYMNIIQPFTRTTLHGENDCEIDMMIDSR